MDKSWGKRIGSICIIILGNILYALVVKLFILPTNLLTGGTTGIGLAVHHLTGLSVSTFVLIFNVCMLIAGFVLLGKKFAMTTIISSFTYPIALEVFNRMLGDYMLTDDAFLCTVFAGLGIGTALGVVIRSGASTGGMDIPPLVLNRYFKIPVSVSLNFFDVCILLLQVFTNKMENVLYGIILVIIYTVVLDKLLLMGTTKTEIKVISEKHKEIRTAIMEEIDRGVTLLSAETGYMGKETQMIFSVVSNRELPKIERVIHNIDPESFMVVSRVSEVRGKGFSLTKEYR